MLMHLFIHHLAVVEQLELHFQSGMTVLTGETGAGKSILIDALSLALGERADSSIIRSGCLSAEISATYQLQNLPQVIEWLTEKGLDSEDECIIRRTIAQDGKSRVYINGRTVPLSQLRELGNQLVNIHGQHAYQFLMKSDHQRQLLDQYANHTELCEAVRKHYHDWQQLKKRYQDLKTSQEQNDQLTLLEYQIQELHELDLQEGELESLSAEQNTLAHAEQWLSLCETALQSLKHEDGHDAFTALYQAMRQIETIIAHTPKLTSCYELLNSAFIQLNEAVSELHAFKETVPVDPKRLASLEERLSHIHALARKHRTSPENLIEHHKKLLEKAAHFTHLESALTELDTQLNAATEKYQHSCQILSKSRQQAAQQLETRITQTIQSLEMPNGRFEIAFTQKPDAVFNPHGIDEIEFLVSTNPGLALQPLRKIASGGELSRMSLAIQVITAQKMSTPTLIFDEVDAGISGKTAETVGKLLKILSQNTQTLCVTHLPQIAAQGDHHFKVEKQQTTTNTTTHIYTLEKTDRVKEIAGMLGGSTITKNALAHAQEMLESASIAYPVNI